jgi:antitoxin HigA-1
MLGPFPAIHPGEVLHQEFLEPLHITPYRLARLCHVPRTRIERIVRGETSLTADTALRLSRYFGTSAEFWMNLQIHYDLTKASLSLEKSLISIMPRETI